MSWYNYGYMQNFVVRNEICLGPANGSHSQSVHKVEVSPETRANLPSV